MRRRVLLAVLVALGLLTTAGVAAATPDPGGPDHGTTATAAAVVIGGRSFSCPAGFSCALAHTAGEGPQVVGVFVVPDGSPPADGAATAATPTPTAAEPAEPAERTERTGRTTTRRHTGRTEHTEHTRRVRHPAPAAATTATPRPITQPTRVAQTDPLPGAINLDAVQRAAEACDAGYGCPLPTTRTTGVVPAPGCTAATARAPDGRCN